MNLKNIAIRLNLHPIFTCIRYLVGRGLPKNLLIILVFTFLFHGNASDNIKIKDVCEWHHKKIIGWHSNHLLFMKRYMEVSDKRKYADTDNKTIERNLLKQSKLLEAIDKAEKKLHGLSKVYHYLECTRFERKIEKD